MKHITRNIFMPVVFILALSVSASAGIISSAKPADPAIEGRWDITIEDGGKKFPAWLEVMHSGHKRLVGQYVGITGSARPVSIIHFTDGKISFSLPPQWEEEDNDLSFKGTLRNDMLTGTMTAADGKTYNWSARRAPLLIREKAPVWGTPIKLFNGKDLTGWKALGKNQWIVENGVLKSPHSGANLITEKKFTDFKLHIEFRCPTGSNSGVYLRGRYEVQIEDSKGKQPQKDLLGAVYGFLTPSKMAAKDAGEWQAYDITLTGRMITVVLNGKKIICNQAIPGVTGGALDSNEGEPGPLYIQGDHGPIEYRNIVLTPAR
ncbi:DUF1080 domain-containing protein [Agriterribacter sp.]|uniref:3-keto-disaccharide hydrolase n=1 Tax=Agriterribacter sp. TaxID=2821509 RepID=UPI002C25706F|nr:DUF1080 domain-containing protein [Agriterribacter sp.]HRP58094.1 DUF1080 domain-containing protein [Agriterribacter sp.]